MVVTSKTRAEVEFLRTQLGNNHPYIVENGGAAYIPRGYFPGSISTGELRDGHHVLEWGTPYQELVASLEQASKASRCRVRGFHEMPPDEIAGLCGFPLEEAVLAKQREYDEPFVVLDPYRFDALVAAIEEQGRKWTRGGRFWHILGSNDKALAVKAVAEVFVQVCGPVVTIGLGDGLNDASFLNAVAAPILIRSAQSSELQTRVPRGLLTDRPGPAGWNDALLAMIPG